jgi:hypothetical protein
VADTLANWPGEAARTAKALGLPYPKSAANKAYDLANKKKQYGYPEYVKSMRTLLDIARINPTKAAEFDDASDLLQSKAVDEIPQRMAEYIVRMRGLDAMRTKTLASRILNVDGKPARARALARDVDAWERADA